MSEISVSDYGCVTKAKAYGLGESVIRAKYPMSVDTDKPTDEITKGMVALAQSKKGEGHDNYLTGIIVQFDLTFTVKAWTEMERYHFIDFVSSQSTIHRIAKFDLDKQYVKYVDKRIVDIMKEKAQKYNECAEDSADKKKELYLELLYSNPVGFKLTAGMTTNYRQLKTIYCQRKNHKLPEWREFCEWIETLPHSYLITGTEG